MTDSPGRLLIEAGAVGEIRPVRAVRIHRVNIEHGVVRIRAEGKGNLAAVRTKRRVAIRCSVRVVRELHLARAIGVDYVKIIPVTLEGRENDLAAVSAKNGLNITPEIVSESRLVGAVCVHYPDLIIAGAGRPEHNLAAVWAKGGVGIEPRIIGQTYLSRAVRVHHVNFEVAVARGNKRDLAAVGTE